DLRASAIAEPLEHAATNLEPLLWIDLTHRHKIFALRPIRRNRRMPTAPRQMTELVSISYVPLTSPTTWPSGSAKGAIVVPPGTSIGSLTVLPPSDLIFSSAATGSSTWT